MKNPNAGILRSTAAIIVALALNLSFHESAKAAGWTASGSLNIARNRHTATLLTNGEVLVAGGRNSLNADLSSAELYDAASGTWTTTGSMNTARFWQTATLLTNGQVLCAAGGGGGHLSSSELYDPVTGTWTAAGN